MLHSAIPAQAVIDLARENQGDKFVFRVSWKHMNKTLQSGKYVLCSGGCVAFCLFSSTILCCQGLLPPFGRRLMEKKLTFDVFHRETRISGY